LTAPTGVSITLDGKMDDWASVPGLQVPLKPIPDDLNEEGSSSQPVTATLKIATDGSNIYVLVTVPDGYDFNIDNHRLSPALGVEWLIDAGAGAAMGAVAPDYTQSGGMVDIWHWELDCGPGELSGGTFASGNDPTCNLDDEYATFLDEREDDDAENSLTGSWDHTARAQGIGAAGTFIFEVKRPLQTGDPHDAQFTLGGTAKLAIAYWDGNEGREKDGGWSDAGHVVSALDGWIDVTLSTVSAAQAPAPASTGNAGMLAESGTSLWLVLVMGALALALVAAGRVATGRWRP
jgi:hypothetical protein